MERGYRSVSVEPNKIEKTILAIECAVGRGSIAVLRGGKVLASSQEIEASPSRAEELLIATDKLLKAASLPLQTIDEIAVSTGPGSYSGIRIGVASALGLGNAVSLKPLGVSVLDALAMTSTGTSKCVSAVPVGKNQVAWREFDSLAGNPNPVSQPTLDSNVDFVAMLATGTAGEILCSPELSVQLTGMVPDKIPMVIFRRGLAELIGLFAARYPEKTSLTPIYLRDRPTAAPTIF